MEVDQPQRIVIIGPAHPFRGGIADTNEAMARGFERAGHKVDLITFTVQYPGMLFPGKTQFSEDSPPKLSIHRWIHSYHPINWLRASSKIKQLRPDIVIIRFWIPFMGPCLGFIARRLRSSTTVIGITDNVVPHEPRMMDRSFTKYFIDGCHGFVALSKAVEADLHSFTTNPTTHFPHPINDQLGEKVEQHQAREELDLDQAGKYILFFGFIRKYKGLDLLLEALGDERLKRLGIKLLVAGESYDGMEEYEKIIERQSLKERVIMHNEFIPTHRIPAFFGAADLVTQTYRSATQSGITQMALHFEKPVLVTKVGGLEEFVLEGRTGLFCEVDPASIADSIVRFFEMDPNSFEQNIQKEKQRFSWDAFVKAFLLFKHDNFDA